MAGFDRARIVGVSENDLDEFTCGICQDILNGPVVTQCCRQIYCKTCIDEWLTKQNTCPNDRKSLRKNDLMTAPRIVVNLLSNMRIKCDYESNGCPVVTPTSELSKHVDECDYKSKNNCKVCGLLKLEGEVHNCVSNLVIKNKSITDEMNRLRAENQRLNDLLKKSTWGMSTVLETSRSFIDNFVVEKTREITPELKLFLINKTKEAIMSKDSFWTICEFLNYELNKTHSFPRTKRWQAVAFSLDGGESAANCQQLFRIRFDNLVIKLFTTKDLNINT